MVNVTKKTQSHLYSELLCHLNTSVIAIVSSIVVIQAFIV